MLKTKLFVLSSENITIRSCPLVYFTPIQYTMTFHLHGWENKRTMSVFFSNREPHNKAKQGKFQCVIRSFAQWVEIVCNRGIILFPMSERMSGAERKSEASSAEQANG